MSGKKVLIIGPGFIGWNVLELLVEEGYSVTGFVRRESHGDQIKASGATGVILGDLHDADKVTAATAEHDIVIHTATADDLPSVRAVLAGIQARADAGQSTIYIHTSGASVFDDEAYGKFKTDTVYRDDVRAHTDGVPDTAPHRAIDLAITRFQAGLGPKAKIAIMIPPLIYGFVPRHGRLTIQIPTLTRFALKHGFVPHVGPGLSVESNIHVLDLARAYVVVLHHLELSPAAATLSNPYFFCECTDDREPSWAEVSGAIAEGLFAAGKIPSSSPKELSKGELWNDLFGQDFTQAVLGLNSRTRAIRLREQLGWKPIEQKDWKRSFLEDELPRILKEEDEGGEEGQGGWAKFKGYMGTVAS